MTNLVARSLELPPDVDFRSVEVDIGPDEPERFAAAQPCPRTLRSLTEQAVGL